MVGVCVMCLCVMIWALRASDSPVFFRLVCGPVICGWEGRGDGLGSGLVLWLLFELGLGGNERYVMRVPGETERGAKRGKDGEVKFCKEVLISLLKKN